jgi:tetrahydromethanopterin S-methyltransferase subunit A
MNEGYYPWGGDFTACQDTSCVAVVLLDTDYQPSKKVAIYGYLKTENIGIEKIVANVISNPNIRYLIVCGKEIRGHRSGSSLIALNHFGIDETHKIIQAPGAIPYIENLDEKAIKRFQSQIIILDLIDEVNPEEIDKVINKCINEAPPSFGEPYIALRIKPEINIIKDKRAIHRKIIVDYLGRIRRRGE